MSDQIYINSLFIQDFGPYYGEHEFDFEVSDGKHVTLIGGKTGAGKTHLLRAIYLATVGQIGFSDLKKRESGTAKFELNQSLNRLARDEGKTVSILRVVLSRRDISGQIGKSLTLEAKIEYFPKFKFSSKAKTNDSGWINDDKDEEEIKKLRNKFLPRHLAQFFFFDAEQEQNISLNESEIIDGISHVIGLYSYSQLVTRLDELRQKLKKNYGFGSESEIALNEIQAQIDKKTKNEEIFTNYLETRKSELKELEKKWEALEEELKSVGVINPAELDEARTKKEEIKQQKDKLHKQLGDSWEKAIPIYLLNNYKNILCKYLESEEARRTWENRRSSVEPYKPQIKTDVFSDIPHKFSLDKEVKSFYENRLEIALDKLFNPPPKGISEKVFVVPESNTLSLQIREELTHGKISNLVQTCSDLDKKTGQYREYEQKVMQLQQNENSIKRGYKLHEEKGDIIANISNLEKQNKDDESQISSLKTNLKELKRQEENLVNKVEKIKKGGDLIGVADKYKIAIREIENNAAIKLRQEISEIVGGLWLDIVDRGMEYVGMEFDNHWDCWLKKSDGSKQKWNDINPSAGQKQVRILAFIEALRQLAELVPPMVVDTPFGRLDKEVKQNVLERLYLSGHQTIILSTNSEVDINTELFDRIAPMLANIYTLNPVGNTESHTYQVNVEKNYFKKVL